jgi:ABC-type branched-subunit amino acid transport system substrate-binding protein/predicted negative regulator of RcsB-dependent stress response
MTRILAALLLLCASCATARRAAGSSEQAAQDDFSRARAALDAGRFDEAVQGFDTFLKQHPQSELADEALYRRGQALARADRLEEAQAALQGFLETRPTSRFKEAVALELKLVQAKLGRNQEAAQALQKSVDEQREREKAEATPRGEQLRAAARAFEGGGPEAAWESALEEAPAPEVARLVADLDKKSKAWPVAALRLARIQLHTGDRTHAAELAAEILLVDPQGPAAEGARSLQHAVQVAAQVKPTLVGIILPLTGDLKGFADQALNGIALTLDLQGRGPLQVQVVDTKGEPDTAADAVEQLAQAGAVVVLGPLGIQEGLAAATRAQQLGVPLVSLSRAEGLTALGDFIFRDMPTSSAQARAVAEYAQKKLNAKSFGILQPDSSYGDEMARYFWDAVDAGGAEVRAYEHYPLRTTTFKPFIQHMVGRAPEDLQERQTFADESEKIAKEITDPYRRRKALALLKGQQAPVVDFDAMFIPDSARTVRLVAPAIAAEDVITTGCDTKELEIVKKTTKNDQLRTVQLLGASLWDSPDLVDERSNIARYVQCSIFVDVFFSQSDRPATKRFVDEYVNAYHRQPGFLEAHAFDVAGLIKKALDERHPQTRAELRDALAGLRKPFEGAAGDTLFGKDREAQKPFFWLWINRGTIQEFDPDGPPPVPPAALPAPAPPTKPVR